MVRENGRYPAVEGVLAAKFSLVRSQADLRHLPVHVFMPPYIERERERHKSELKHPDVKMHQASFDSSPSAAAGSPLDGVVMQSFLAELRPRLLRNTGRCTMFLM